MLKREDNNGMFRERGRKYLTISLIGHVLVFVLLIGLSFSHIRIKRLRDFKPITVYAIEQPVPTPRKVEEQKPEPKSTPKPVAKTTPKPVATPMPEKKVVKKPEKTPTPKKTPRTTPKPTPTPRKQVAKAKPTPTPGPYRPKSRPTPVPRSTPAPNPRSTPARTPPPSTIPQQQGPLKVEASELPGYYLESVKMRIESNFAVPQHLKNTPAQCTIQFTIFRNGSMGEVAVIKSSGSSYMDNLAIQAIESTGQLGPLPDTFPRQSIQVILTFDFSQ